MHSNSASRARPGMHQRGSSLDTTTAVAGGAQMLISPLNPPGLAASGAQATSGAGVREVGTRAGRGGAALGESRRRAPAASRRAENDENSGPPRCGTDSLWLQQQDWPLGSSCLWQASACLRLPLSHVSGQGCSMTHHAHHVKPSPADRQCLQDSVACQLWQLMVFRMWLTA